MFMNRIPFILAFLLTLASCPARAADKPAPKSSPASVTLNNVLWRTVQNREGKPIGGVSDVLVQMPSGRIVFVAIDPNEFFSPAKAVPPASLTAVTRVEDAMRLEAPSERWFNAPTLEWNGARVIQNTAAGEKIYAYYQQRWLPPDVSPGWVNVPTPTGTAAPERYVSLKKLLLHRVSTPAGEPTGFIRDFLINWNNGRATHALVSPEFSPAGGRDAAWFAVPLSLLGPPDEDQGITVNAKIDAFRQAPAAPAAGVMPNATQIYRYPAVARK
jgi:sporulation protein YlmC with PRC-barrel domain